MKVSFQGINDISAKNFHLKNGDLISSEVNFRLDNEGKNHLDLFRDEYEETTGKKFIGDKINFRMELEDDYSWVPRDNFRTRERLYLNNRLVRKNPSTESLLRKMTLLLGEICEDTPLSSFTNPHQKGHYLEKHSFDPITNIFKKIIIVDTIRTIKEKSLLAMVESLVKKSAKRKPINKILLK